MRNVELCVIGSGPAGQRAAIQAAKLGKRVIVVEKREVVGGVTVNTGTIPSKALREAILSLAGRPNAMARVEDFYAARNATFTGLQAAVQRVITHEIENVRRHMASNGIEVIHGAARFEDANTVHVEGRFGEDEIRAENILISVGSRPARPDKIPFDDSNVITSDEILKLGYLPTSAIVVGGGVIGTEYASMLTALGVRTTLVEGRSGLLGFVDEEITEALQYHLRQADTTIRFGEKVVKVDVVEPPSHARTANGKMVEATLESGKTLRADALLYTVGRQGATDGLDLHKAGLEADPRGRVKVNDRFQTDVPHIYAAGDVIGFPALASTSMEQGRIAACDMFDLRVEHMPELLPYGIYAIPEISMVGWTEQRLTEEGIPFESGKAQYDEIARGMLLGDEIGMLKLLIHQESNQILGVHAIGSGATELIHIGQAVMAFKGAGDPVRGGARGLHAQSARGLGRILHVGGRG
ncbi:MAG: Si-specific NAD(P)(+) transhydrogenase, partial [Planctomycetota bacterium]